MNGSDDGLGAPAFVERVSSFQRQYQRQLDRTTPHTLYRWLSTLGLLFLFIVRILIGQAYYIVCYALGIYLLNLFLAFLQPKLDPALEMDQAEAEVEEGAPGLPTSNGLSTGRASLTPTGARDDDEFRPFIRRLGEFTFWYSATRATAIALVCTAFPIFDVPVYWPILLVYFITLFTITMRRQLEHMKKYKYVPWDHFRKARFGNGAK